MKKKKILLLCIAAGILLIGALVLFLCQNRSQSDSRQAQTSSDSVDQDFSRQKEDALKQMEEAYERLPAADQEECAEYMEQSRNNIENADTERTIQAVLAQTLEYLQGRGKETPEETVSKSDTGEDGEENEELYPLGTEKDGREYTPIANPSNWEYYSDAKKEAVEEKSIPVLKDKNNTIDVICQDVLNGDYTYSYTLAIELGLWCEEQGIQANEGEYLAYGTYQDNQESFYLVLDDEEESVLLVTYYKQSISWKFEKIEETKEEIMSRVRNDEGDAGLPE